MNQLDQLAAGALVRARPWDVVGAALAAPMVLWGFLGWFGAVGDSGGGTPGFFSGTGATGIGLVLAAAAITLNQVLEGRPHLAASPPVAALLAGSGALVVLGGMIAKPDSATIQAGSVVGLLTALTQVVVLVLGWLRGSDKSVKAGNVRAVLAQQAAADQGAAALAAQRAATVFGQPGYAQPGYPQPRYPIPGYPPQQGYPQPSGYPQQPAYPPQPAYPQQPGYPPQPAYPQQPGPGSGQQGYPQRGYPPPGPSDQAQPPPPAQFPSPDQWPQPPR